MAASSPGQQGGAPVAQQHLSTHGQAQRQRPRYPRISRKQAIWILGIALVAIAIIIAILQVLGAEGHLPKLGADIASAVSGACLFLFACIPILLSLSQSETAPSTASSTPTPATTSQKDQAQAASAHIESVFLVGAPLPRLGEFYGRLDERTTLFDRTRKGYSTSIVGERRIVAERLRAMDAFEVVDLRP